MVIRFRPGTVPTCPITLGTSTAPVETKTMPDSGSRRQPLLQNQQLLLFVSLPENSLLTPEKMGDMLCTPRASHGARVAGGARRSQ